MAVGGIENFNKSIEITQRYYNDRVQNNFNYLKLLICQKMNECIFGSLVIFSIIELI